MQERIRRAHIKHTPLCLLSVDISNAFGSVNHDAIWPAVTKQGIGNWYADIYNGACTRILHDEGLSDVIDVKVGVKQGEPISGVLFNLYTHPIVKSIQINDTVYKILAIADDYFLICEDINELQRNADTLCEMGDKLGSQIKP